MHNLVVDARAVWEDNVVRLLTALLIELYVAINYYFTLSLKNICKMISFFYIYMAHIIWVGGQSYILVCM